MPIYKFNIFLKGTGETPQDAYKKALEVLSQDPISYMELAIDFSPLFHFAEKEFGICWNDANRLFFRTILEWKSITSLSLQDLHAYVTTEEGDARQYFSEMQLDDNFFLEKEAVVQASCIAAKWIISLGITKVVIDCR